MVLRLLIITVAFAIAVSHVPQAKAASESVLRSRQHRQERSLHARLGTVVFFRNRPRLARTRPGRRALHVAHVWIPIIRRELRETVVSLRPRPAGSPRLAAWLCIHHYEGAWNANTGNGYHGGLQMDARFMRTYGAEFLARWGDAENWPPWAQIAAADRAYRSGRGFTPWPNTSRACGLA